MDTLNHKIIKVCKIDSINFAGFALRNGIDFLGVHVLWTEQIGLHSELVSFILSQNGKAIIVTKIERFEDLCQLVNHYNPSGLQLHYEVNIHIAGRLRSIFPDLLLFGVVTDQTLFRDFSLLDSIFNYIIYDTTYDGGTNQHGPYSLLPLFSEQVTKKTLLAGGISLERIRELSIHQSAGYDIQSYFRDGPQLNFKKLDEICDEIKSPRRRLISVSLTDLPLIEMYQASRYYTLPIYDYHLDISDGSLYKSFITTAKSIEEKAKFLLQMPFSLHLFAMREQELTTLVESYSKTYPFNLVRVFIQYRNQLDVNKLIRKFPKVKFIISVYHKELRNYFQSTVDHSFISVVVPASDNSESIEEMISIINEHASFFREKELWLDRNLNVDYIDLFMRRLDMDFNVIIGKEIIYQWNKIADVYEHISSKRAD